MNTSTLSTNRFAMLVSLACLFAASAAHAGDPAATGRVTVTYRDLNISTVAGATTLYQRIRGAAKAVCGEEGKRLEEHAAWGRCYQSAVSGAVAAVNSPMLSAVAGGQARGPVTAMVTP
jgi:UrcA family protein